MKGPTPLMRKAAESLFGENAGERRRFLEALSNPPDLAPWILWTGAGMQKVPVTEPAPRHDWLPDFAMRWEPGVEPGKHPLHAEGAFYSLDFSSIWAASAMLATGSEPGKKRVLDVCAAPGGKSIFASLALRPEFLLANEVIGKRLAVLRHNLKRCRIPNAFTQRLDPRDLATAAPGAFDLVIVDAPCSGQSLLAKGIENPGAFHPATVKGNAKRQLGIVTAAAACVAPGGWLLYSTCTFSERENERVVSKFLERRPDFETRPVPRLAEWRSPLAEFPCYRLYPQSGLGAGGFVALLARRESGGEPGAFSGSPLLAQYPVEL